MVGLSDFAGCDTYTSYKGSGRWAFDWQETWMALDMLRSIHPQKPIFNSENHFFRGDGSPSWLEPAPEEYFYSTLMGEAIHGQYATLIWGKYPEKNVQDRPEAVRGIERAISDIQRLSEPIAALAGMTTRVSIFFSSSTMIADAATLPREQGFTKKSRYLAELRSVYEELITSGIPVSFVYEEFPLTTQLKPDDILILPGVTRMESASFKQLSQMVASGAKVILYNSEVTKDEHGQPLKDDTLHQAANVQKLKSVQEITAKIKDMAKPECEIFEGGSPARDVEWRFAAKGDKAFLFVLNHSNQNKSLSLKTKFNKAVNLLDHQELDKHTFSVLPLSVRIFELRG
jgi:beta-galactosidase GanA